MRHSIRTLAILLCLGAAPALGTLSCTAMTGNSAGQNVDDATLTAQVKSKLAGDRLSTLTRIDVDSNRGTVYLNGTVESAAAKERAAELTSQVSGVQNVVNNLKVQAGG